MSEDVMERVPIKQMTEDCTMARREESARSVGERHTLRHILRKSCHSSGLAACCSRARASGHWPSGMTSGARRARSARRPLFWRESTWSARAAIPPVVRLVGAPPPTKRLLAFERRWCQPHTTTSYNALLEPRWRVGVRLGRWWGSPLHLVFGADAGHVQHDRAVQLRPAADRWLI